MYLEENFKRSPFFRLFYKIRSNLHYYLYFKNRFAQLSNKPSVWGIWNVEVFGPNIRLGKNTVILGAAGDRTRITSVKVDRYEGSIQIGNNVIIMSGVRISSAVSINIGDDCMLANYCYLTDADWHDLYNRTIPVGRAAPIVLGKGVWVGDSAIICKGVTIGENSVVGAGSVVRKNVPPNVVVLGNPAKVVKKLDPKKIVTIGSLYKTAGDGQGP